MKLLVANVCTLPAQAPMDIMNGCVVPGTTGQEIKAADAMTNGDGGGGVHEEVIVLDDTPEDESQRAPPADDVVTVIDDDVGKSTKTSVSEASMKILKPLDLDRVKSLVKNVVSSLEEKRTAPLIEISNTKPQSSPNKGNLFDNITSSLLDPVSISPVKYNDKDEISLLDSPDSVSKTSTGLDNITSIANSEEEKTSDVMETHKTDNDLVEELCKIMPVEPKESITEAATKEETPSKNDNENKDDSILFDEDNILISSRPSSAASSVASSDILLESPTPMRDAGSVVDKVDNLSVPPSTNDAVSADRADDVIILDANVSSSRKRTASSSRKRSASSASSDSESFVKKVRMTGDDRSSSADLVECKSPAKTAAYPSNADMITVMSDEMVHLVVRQKLNRMMTKEMEHVVGPLRKRVADLQATNDWWKNLAVKLQRQITELDLIKQRNKHKQDSVDKKPSMRTVAVQVSTSIQSHKARLNMQTKPPAVLQGTITATMSNVPQQLPASSSAINLMYKPTNGPIAANVISPTVTPMTIATSVLPNRPNFINSNQSALTNQTASKNLQAFVLSPNSGVHSAANFTTLQVSNGQAFTSLVKSMASSGGNIFTVPCTISPSNNSHTVKELLSVQRAPATPAVAPNNLNATNAITIRHPGVNQVLIDLTKEPLGSISSTGTATPVVRAQSLGIQQLSNVDQLGPMTRIMLAPNNMPVVLQPYQPNAQTNSLQNSGLIFTSATPNNQNLMTLVQGPNGFQNALVSAATMVSASNITTSQASTLSVNNIHDRPLRFTSATSGVPSRPVPVSVQKVTTPGSRFTAPYTTVGSMLAKAREPAAIEKTTTTMTAAAATMVLTPTASSVATTVATTVAGSTTVMATIQHPAPLPPKPVVLSAQPSKKDQAPTPTLKISRVTQGLVLSWNMTLTPQHEEITNYQLYAYQEGTAPASTALWKKVGEVKALPLPMACTLTQFEEGKKYHFAVRAVDKCQRIGSFSDPASIYLAQTAAKS